MNITPANMTDLIALFAAEQPASARAIFGKAIDEAEAKGRANDADDLRLAMEYLTNDTFRRGIQQVVRGEVQKVAPAL